MPKKNNPYVKIANEVTEYTPEQILELDMCASDAVHCISKYFHIQHPVKGSMPFNLHPYQAEIIHRAQHNYYNIITIARQGGKCVHKDTYIQVLDSNRLNIFQRMILWCVNRL